jgi:metal-sulfur cluster biosynthetic enzyme
MVSKEMSEEHVRRVLADVKHPAIDRTLLDLGIIRSIEVENDNVKILLAFPFPNIPIAEQLINSVREPLNKEGLAVEALTTVMAEEELHKFLAMEQEGWKGAI